MSTTAPSPARALNPALVAVAFALCMPLGYFLLWREERKATGRASLELRVGATVLVLTFLWVTFAPLLGE